MLPLGHTDWQYRIARWEDLLDKIRPGHLDRVKRYAGPAYAGLGIEDDLTGYDPISHTFAAISRFAPQMLSGAPNFAVGSTREKGLTDAKKIEAGLNRLVVQSDWVTTNEMLVADFWIGPYAVTLNTVEPIPGFSDFDELPHWPSRKRIPPFSFLGDADEGVYTDWRFMGHRVVMDHDEALELAEQEDTLWNYDALMQVTPGVVETKDGIHQHGGDYEDRKQFEFYRIWVPEVDADALREIGYDPGEEDEFGRPYTAEGGYNGAWFYVLRHLTLDGAAGDDSDYTFIHDPHPAYGPRWGCYTYYPGYVVPDEPLSLAPDVAAAAQNEASNTAARALIRAIKRNKNLLFVSAAAPDVETAVEEAEDGDVVTVASVEDITKAMVPVRLGGPTPELQAGAAYLYELSQLTNGLDDQQRGRANPDATATASAIAARASSVMMSFLAGKFRKGNEQDGRTAGWFMYHHELVEIALGIEHGFQTFVGGPDSAILKRGRSPEAAQRAIMRYGSVENGVAALRALEKQQRERERQDPFDAMDFSIDQYSMDRTADGMAAAQLAGLRDTLQWLPQLLATPGVRPEETIELVGQLSNVQGLSRIIDPAVFLQIQMLALQGQMQPTPAPERQRLASDRGPTGMLGPSLPQLALPQKAGAGGPSPIATPPTPGNTMMPGRSTGALAGAALKAG